MPDTFHIIPASTRALWGVLAVTIVVVAVVLGLLVAALRGARTSRFELSVDGLRLHGDAYGRLIPADQLRGGAARLVDLSVDRDLAPSRRTTGTSVPGYRAGWFRLRDGEKALLYVTDPTRVVYVPTDAGYSLLLSVQEPERFLSRLREVAPAG